jgi:hypothetical protein
MTGHKDIVDSLRSLSKTASLDLDPSRMVEALKGESDRGAIILASTMIDDRLRWAIEQKITSLNSDEMARFFRHDAGIAGAFSQRIVLAQALGIIDRKTRKHIDLVREMRNASAHAANQLSFASPEIVAALNYLKGNSSAPIEDWTVAMRRDVFVILCATIAASISNSMSASTFETIRPIFESMLERVPTWLEKSQPPQSPDHPDPSSDK